MIPPEVPPLDAPAAAAVRDLAADVTRRGGGPPLSDAALGRLRSPAARHWRTAAGYAQLADGSLELLAADARSLEPLLDAVERDVATAFLVWSHGAGSAVGATLEGRGYHRIRVLHRLVRGLQDLPAARPLPTGIEVRALRVGVDEDAWLRVNAAAFASHPEQGRWSRADVEEREGEPWFRAGDVLLAWRDRALAGFHWTKVHPDGQGEVYILGVDPSAQGTGLGGALLDAGLHHLAGRGCPTVLLYVDDDNSAAMRLYERAGFSPADTDIQWRRPAPA
ncbi:MAG: mycothiol synthase [Jatrophihabitans sp.]|nr:MAG: mycothiol synthase [Jatrophihabitans sp.]